MNSKIKIISLCLVLYLSCTSSEKNYPDKDRNLIIPGETAEGYKLGEEVDLARFTSYKKIDGDIGSILNLDFFSGLKFDSVIYTKESSVLFLNGNIVTAIAGLKIERRITSDAVLLSKGIDNFILNYGNSGLAVIKKGNQRAYIYKELGIAVFNDNSENTIDMYLIFKK